MKDDHKPYRIYCLLNYVEQCKFSRGLYCVVLMQALRNRIKSFWIRFLDSSDESQDLSEKQLLYSK